MRKKPSKKLQPFPGGLIACYIGDGKGKTTAAVGAATRARGYGMRVLFFQFFKSPDWPSGERTALRQLGATVQVHGKGFVGILGDTRPLQEHKKAAREALQKSQKEIMSGKYNVVVLDEIISCVEVGLFSQIAVADMLKKVKKSPRSRKVHVILTGHVKYPKIIAQADLVSEIKMIKHPYYKGYLAIKGIDF